MFNLHTHTYRCNHAKGNDEDYVLCAIENGYDTIGFSDHAPYIFDGTKYSGFRMKPEETEDYVNSVNRLKEKYKNQIDIKLGFEVEWYPDLIQRELAFLKSFHYDYIILGQHYTHNEFDHNAFYTGHKTKSIETLDSYIDQVLAGAESGEFAYVAHPDVINFTGDHDLFMEKMRKMAERLKETDIPLEYNFLGYTDNRHYPRDDFWKMVSEIGNRVVIGLDAHSPDVYGKTEELRRFKEKLSSLGITPIEDINEIL